MLKHGDIVKLRPRYFRQLGNGARRSHLKNTLFMVRRTVSEGLTNIGFGKRSFDKIIEIESLESGQREALNSQWVTFVRRPQDSDAVAFARARARVVAKQCRKISQPAPESFDEASVRYAKMSWEDKMALARSLLKKI